MLSLHFDRHARKVSLLAATTAAVLAVATPAAAQTVCLPYERVSKQLAEQYDEHPIAMGLADSGRLVQVFAKADGDSWTIVQTNPAGQSCIAASGRYWHVIDQEPKGLTAAVAR